MMKRRWRRYLMRKSPRHCWGMTSRFPSRNLVERATGTHLQKSHGFTDWLRRPLSPGQIEYALDDVRYLVPVYDHLVRELDARGRLEWAREEFRRLEDEKRYQPADPYDLYLRIRGVERMRGRTLAALRELAAWREETARAQNIPVGRVARDEVLIELARRPRNSVKELGEVRGLLPQQIERFGAAMIKVAQRSTEVPLLKCPRQARTAVRAGTHRRFPDAVPAVAGGRAGALARGGGDAQ